MALPPLIAIVCSDRHRNGKTLLSRVLVDFLLLEGRDPFVLDLDFQEGTLRDFFPGRTALVDFSVIAGRMKVFDTILASPGRDYVIDLPGQQLKRFCDAVADLQFRPAARTAGFSFVTMFIVDEDEDSLKAAADAEESLTPDLFVPVVNRFVGSALPSGIDSPVLIMEKIDNDLHAIITYRRFSFRAFLLGEESGVPFRLRSNLKTFLHTLMAGFREIGPALSLLKLRS